MRNARPAEGPRSGTGGPRRAPGGGGLPMRRHRAPAAAVPPRYVAEVGLYARFPAHVQLPDHAVAHGRLLPKDPDLPGSSAGPRAVAELARMRWRDWRAYGGANGRSALAEMAVFAVALATASGSRATAWRSWPAATSARRRGISRSMGRGGGVRFRAPARAGARLPCARLGPHAAHGPPRSSGCGDPSTRMGGKGQPVTIARPGETPTILRNPPARRNNSARIRTFP